VVDKHGGTLRFDTEVGKGTTFYIRLPIAGPPPASAAA
jgi:signal transduction histidine kinase